MAQPRDKSVISIALDATTPHRRRARRGRFWADRARSSARISARCAFHEIEPCGCGCGCLVSRPKAAAGEIKQLGRWAAEYTLFSGALRVNWLVCTYTNGETREWQRPASTPPILGMLVVQRLAIGYLAAPDAPCARAPLLVGRRACRVHRVVSI